MNYPEQYREEPGPDLDSYNEARNKYLYKLSDSLEKVENIIESSAGFIDIDFIVFSDEYDYETIEDRQFGIFFERHERDVVNNYDDPVRTEQTLLLRSLNDKGGNVYTFIDNVYSPLDPNGSDTTGLLETCVIHLHQTGIVEYDSSRGYKKSDICTLNWANITRMSPFIKNNHDQLQVMYDPEYASIEFSDRVADLDLGVIDTGRHSFFSTWRADLEYIDSILSRYTPLDVRFPRDY